jgi:hypothetical protein
VAICGHPTQTVAISPGALMAINGNQWQSMAINGNQWQSMAINGNQWQSMAISGNRTWSSS